MDFRIEQDSLGEKQIPSEALYGIQTQRAVENFPISGETLLPEIVVSYAIVKKAAAQVNMDIGKLKGALGQKILQVCDEIIAGKYSDQFVVDVFQAGAGTSTNMNLNEVIANRVLEMMGEEKGSYDIVSPNDHVNMSQSTNDTYPTMMRVAILRSSKPYIKNLKLLIKSFEKKSKEFKNIVTSARTHLQDAVPITLGQEFQSYVHTLKGLKQSYEGVLEDLLVLGIGGSASGTGINTHKEYHKRMVKELSTQTGIKFKKSSDLIESMQSQRQIGTYMNTLSQIAGEISRICNDLRLLSSGPHTGIGEINLPPVQPGSSIMPGKVNPSIVECMNLVNLRVIGSQTIVSNCLMNSQLNLNIYSPLMIYEALTATHLFTNACIMMSEKCVSGITANKDVCERYAYESNGIFTILNPILGYHTVALIVKERDKTGKGIREILLEKTDMSGREIDKLLDPKKLTEL